MGSRLGGQSIVSMIEKDNKAIVKKSKTIDQKKGQLLAHPASTLKETPKAFTKSHVVPRFEEPKPIGGKRSLSFWFSLFCITKTYLPPSE